MLVTEEAGAKLKAIFTFNPQYELFPDTTMNLIINL